MTAIEIKRANPKDFVDLLNASEAYMASLYPAESNHVLDIETLCLPQMHFFGTNVGGVAKACGGFWAYSDYAEIKRVYVDPSARGLGLGQKLMRVLEEAARAEGFKIARLETGISQPEALRLYEKLGYKYREPFGDYQPDPYSRFMEKAL